jgi:predicted anti-sigma-YlaC factor YlaD
MSPTGPAAEHVPCIDFVEMVTDYLDGALPPGVHAAIDEHLALCPGCVTVLDQFRTVVRVTGALRAEHVDALAPDVRRELMAAFRQRG